MLVANVSGLNTLISYTCSKKALFFFVPGNVICLVKSAGIMPKSNRPVTLSDSKISSSLNKSKIVSFATN